MCFCLPEDPPPLRVQNAILVFLFTTSSPVISSQAHPTVCGSMYGLICTTLIKPFKTGYHFLAQLLYQTCGWWQEERVKSVYYDHCVSAWVFWKLITACVVVYMLNMQCLVLPLKGEYSKLITHKRRSYWSLYILKSWTCTKINFHKGCKGLIWEKSMHCN